MPKLSRYISHETDIKASGIVFCEGVETKVAGSTSQRHHESTKLLSKDDGREEGGTVPGRSSRLVSVMTRRVQECGERQYRWSDGTLRSTKPPRNPYAVSSRKSWSALVRYCREHGGDVEYAASQRSMRYGIEVQYKDHVEYLAALGLSTEVDEQDNYLDFDKDKTHPLKDPQHAFNSYYAEEAKRLFQ